jgi:predicted  nucleic acid-binding Zn-ribbon protein
MKVPAPVRGFVLAAACITAFQGGGCAWSSGGPPPGYDPNRGAGAKPGQQQSQQASQNANSQSSSGQPGNFSSVVKSGGVSACMNINEDQVPTNYFETVGVATVAGAFLAALLGAAAGAVLSKDHGSGAATGAVIGGVAGGALGAASGVQTAEQKKYYAVQLARYDCQLEAAQNENANLKASGEALQNSVDTLTGQLDQLENDYANKRITKAQADKELASIDASAAALKTRMTSMKANSEEYEQMAAQTQQTAQGTRRKIDETRVDQLDREIADMRDQNEDLEREYDKLVERRKAVVLQ